jgi:hypothetical protein
LFGLRDSDITAAGNALISRHFDYLDAAMANGTFHSIFNSGFICQKCESLIALVPISSLEWEFPRHYVKEIWLSTYEALKMLGRDVQYVDW